MYVFTDNNKFGQKLMEKFGWTKGKGLGANEDGKVDHVKVSVKTDQRGVGCSVSHADNWIAHQDDFNSILENLNQSNTDSQLGSTPGEVISLETKSKNSKGRMHYKKFAKGKDLSSRTTEDLNCIFGVRKTKSGDNTPQCISEENSDCESQRENEDSGGLKTIRSSDSVQEYFAKKMAALKKITD
ncbi:hypothetical protein FSP39_008082 [Pinctada imbricata]|uniref:G-patch domain-containing protein n=1 Tax=Pinctada imbricata TaxID=66713 RepID=A0AA88YN29_PINIB|nr:hypothetical protein FSP39_008082 [Pinctada imbricata]